MFTMCIDNEARVHSSLFVVHTGFANYVKTRCNRDIKQASSFCDIYCYIGGRILIIKSMKGCQKLLI